MKKLDIHRLTWDKEANILSVCESDIKDFGITMLNGSMDTFEIQGAREARRYMSAGCVRENARHEIGDVLYWIYRPVSGHGIYQPGPVLHVFND